MVLEKKISPVGGADADRQHAVSMLMPGIDEIVNEARWDKRQLDCLVVGQGPGSFTGIRTAVVTARTLAQGLAVAAYRRQPA